MNLRDEVQDVFYDEWLTDSQYETIIALVEKECDAKLLNAFQLVKNGIQIGTLKFPEFKKLMEIKHDHNGKAKGKR